MKKIEFRLLDVKLILLCGNKFNISYENCEEKDFEIKENEDLYTIFQKNKTERLKKILFNFTINSNDATIKVTIPNNLDAVNIKGENNSILADNISVNMINIVLENGSIKLKNIESNNIDIICKNGMLNLSELEIKEILNIDLINGTLKLKSGDNENIKYDVRCENGIINNKFKNLDTLGDIKYNIKCKNGIISIK